MIITKIIFMIAVVLLSTGLAATALGKCSQSKDFEACLRQAQAAHPGKLDHTQLDAMIQACEKANDCSVRA